MAKRAKRKIARSRLPLQRHLGLELKDAISISAVFKQNKHTTSAIVCAATKWFGAGNVATIRKNILSSAQIQEEIVLSDQSVARSKICSLWFLEYILYYEMLHAVVPDKPQGNGRRCVDTDEFNRREREFRFYKRARRWEDENLARFLGVAPQTHPVRTMRGVRSIGSAEPR